LPLLIDLKPGEKVIINGAVLENAGSNTKVRVLNESNILRQKEILTEQDANSPAGRVYWGLQCAYIFPERREHYLGVFDQFLDEYLAAAPSAAAIAEEVRAKLAANEYYKALKAGRKLLKHEAQVLDRLNSDQAG
jgi:flagellar protein FlbT